MKEVEIRKFTHKKLAEILVKHDGLHEGIWALNFELGIGGAVLNNDDGDAVPTAIVPIRSVGLVRSEEETAISVDASQVNPPKRARRKARPAAKKK